VDELIRESKNTLVSLYFIKYVCIMICSVCGLPVLFVQC